MPTLNANANANANAKCQMLKCQSNCKFDCKCTPFFANSESKATIIGKLMRGKSRVIMSTRPREIAEIKRLPVVAETKPSNCKPSGWVVTNQQTHTRTLKNAAHETRLPNSNTSLAHKFTALASIVVRIRKGYWHWQWHWHSHWH